MTAEHSNQGLGAVDPRQPNHTPIVQLQDMPAEERINVLYTIVANLIRRHSYTESKATELALLILETLAQVSNHELIEVADTIRARLRRARDTRVRADLRTGNAGTIARREGLSVSQVYRIANARRPAQRAPIRTPPL